MDQKNRFISRFVNEMYVIIIGIGIGHILFIQELNIKELNQIIMALFVTSIVLSYWWDWSENIENNVQTTKREFLIDFFILVFLEFLFANYNNPLRLCSNLLVISSLDLIWTINYIFESKGELKHSIIEAKPWIIEKLCVIFIYTLTLLVLQAALLSEYAFIHGYLVICSFLLGRRVGFRHIRREKELIFRPATNADIEQSVEINGQFIDSYNVRYGLLLTKYDSENIERAIYEEEACYFVVENMHNEILGYVIISRIIDQELLDKLVWHNEQMSQRILCSDNNIYIEQIAVKKGLHGKGIGCFMYKQLSSMFNADNFLAFVISKPVKNRTSIAFHKKQGFSKAAVFNAKKFLGLDNYQSILFVKTSSSHHINVIRKTL